MDKRSTKSRIDLSLLSAGAFDALWTALSQFVENTRESVEMTEGTRDADPREAAQLAEAEALLEQLDAHVASAAG